MYVFCTSPSKASRALTSSIREAVAAARTLCCCHLAARNIFPSLASIAARYLPHQANLPPHQATDKPEDTQARLEIRDYVPGELLCHCTKQVSRARRELRLSWTCLSQSRRTTLWPVREYARRWRGVM